MDAQFVFNAAHIHTAIAFVIDKHRQTTTIGSTFFRACQNKVNVSIAIGDEAFHAVEQPATLFFRIGGFEHHALEVATRIGFCQVHRHSSPFSHARNEARVLILVAKFV